jgi:hypothetical protein
MMRRLFLGGVGRWGVERVVGRRSVGGVSREDRHRSGMVFVGALGRGRFDRGAPSELGSMALIAGGSVAPSAGAVGGVRWGGVRWGGFDGGVCPDCCCG